MFSKFLNLLMRPTASKVAAGIIISPYLIAAVLKCQMNTFDPQGTASKYFELYDVDDEPVVFNRSVQNLFDQEIECYDKMFNKPEDIVFSLRTTRDYCFVTSNDSEFRSFGNPFLMNGAILCLPFFLNFDDVKDVNDSYLYVQPYFSLWNRLWNLKKRIKLSVDDWTRYEELKNALVLTPDAKRFGIRRYLHQANSNIVIYEIATFCAPAVVASVISSLCDFSVKLKKIGPRARLASLLMIFLSAPLVHILAKSKIYDAMINSMDLDILESFPELKQGAVEFFEKWIQRNKAYSNLLKHQGVVNYRYTNEGEDLVSHTLLLDRLNNVRSFVFNPNKSSKVLVVEVPTFGS